MSEGAKNCRGCGAALVKVRCPYCGRVHDRPADIRPAPEADPKKRFEPRKVFR